MEPLKIRVGLGATVALPGYNSIRIDYSQEAYVQPGDSIEEVREALYADVDKYVDTKLKEMKADAGE